MKNFKHTPHVILKAKSNDHVLDYKWTKKTMEKLIDPLDENIELENLLNTINHKASLGLSAALLEWIYWRLKKYDPSNVEIAFKIEALWSSIENSKNTKPLSFDENLEAPTFGSIYGPVWTALMNIRMIDNFYKQGSSLLQSELVGLVLLARHITPKRKIFDKWFENTMEILVELFPNQNEVQVSEIENSVYDFSNEPVLSRELFFEPGFRYDESKAKSALGIFISNIDYNVNPFCCNRNVFTIS